MIFYILLIIAISLVLATGIGSDWGEAGMVAVLSVMVLHLFCVACSFHPSKEIARNDYTDPIYSLRTDTKLSGSFVIGSGYIDSVEHYVFFRKDNRGGFFRENISTNNAYIFEKDVEQPYMSWQKITYIANPILVPRWVSPEREKNTTYDLVVPKGTIIQKFEVR